MKKGRMKKGQAALEFLTTYGWAFLIILVMIGALAYFGVLNPTKFVPDSCTFASPFTCDASVANPTDITFRFRNNAEALTISSFNVSDADTGIRLEGIEAATISGTCSRTGTTISCPSGGVATLTYANDAAGAALAYASGIKKKFSVNIKYYYAQSGAQFGKSSTGTIVSAVQ